MLTTQRAGAHDETTVRRGPERLPYLNGLRGIAIAMVISQHLLQFRGYGSTTVYLLGPLMDGDLGVQIFFVLSGFLITSLLLKGRDKGSLASFYRRRAYRILPGFFAFIAGMAAINRIAGFHIAPSNFALAGLFLWNYAINRPYWFGHTWSLAVEEQFYLLWPWLVRRLRPQRTLLIALALTVAFPISRKLTWVYWPSHRTTIWEMFHTRGDALMWGCVLALVPVAAPRATRAVERVARWWVTEATAVLYLAVAAPYLLHRYGWTWQFSAGYTCDAVATAAIIACCVYNERSLIRRVLSIRPLVALGVLSYSLYLWQQVFFVPYVHLPALERVGGAFAAGLASYFLVERPYLMLRDLLDARRQQRREQMQVPAPRPVPVPVPAPRRRPVAAHRATSVPVVAPTQSA